MPLTVGRIACSHPCQVTTGAVPMAYRGSYLISDTHSP